MVIVSKNNPQVKQILSLKEKKYRKLYGEYLVEGIKQVREASEAGYEIEKIVYSQSYAGEEFRSIESMVVADNLFARLSDEVTPQGILAVLKIPKVLPVSPRNNALLLDGVSDPGNLGTIIRTANAAGYEDIYLINGADPFSPKCVRSAMSGLFFVRIHIGSREEILASLDGIPLVCADMDGENVFEFTPPKRFCLVIGNEANGVSESIRKNCERTIRIPMRKTCESLNAGVSAGILMYMLSRYGG